MLIAYNTPPSRFACHLPFQGRFGGGFLEVNKMIKTITFGSFTAYVLSDEPYFYKSEKYVWIRNKSDADIFISNNSTDFLELPAGYAGRLDVPPGNTIYFDGSGDAEIYTSDVSSCPWKIGSAGGSGGGGSAVLGVKNITANGTYHAENDSLDGYDTVNVNIELADTSGLRPAELGDKNITGNGIYRASDDSFDGYHTVNVNVSSDLGRKTVTANGIYNASDDGLDGYSRVVVRVSGGGSSANLGEKTVTENGVYNADEDDLDGYSKVTVNTPVKTLGAKSITANGIYRPSDDFLDGYDYIIVNIPTGTLAGMVIKPIIGTAERIDD